MENNKQYGDSTLPLTKEQCTVAAEQIAKLEKHFKETGNLVAYKDPYQRFEIIPIQEKNGLVQYFVIDKMPETGFLGTGTFADVYEGYWFNSDGELISTDKERMVAKIVDLNAGITTVNALNEEVRIQSKYLPTRAQRVDNSYYILMPYMGTDFHKAFEEGNFNNLTFTEMTKIARDLALNLAIHHNKNVLLNDVKSLNTMLDGKEVAFVDYGEAREVDGDPNKLRDTDYIVGTPLTMTPQVRNKKMGAKNDVSAFASLETMVLGNQNPEEDKLKHYKLNQTKINNNIVNNIVTILKVAIEKIVAEKQANQNISEAAKNQIIEDAVQKISNDFIDEAWRGAY